MNKEKMIILDENNKEIFFMYKERKIKVNIIYRKRKSISIKIIPKDKIDIISPKSVSITYLRDLIIKKIDWIIKTLDKFENLDDSFENRDYKDEEIFYYLGEKYKLRIIKDKNISNSKKDYCIIEIRDNYLEITTNNYDKEYIKNELKKWYKVESEKIVIDRIQYLRKHNSIINSLNPGIVKIKEQKKRWGTCTSAKSIYINSRISMAKVHVIDYIIVHEYCHLVHMNHSKDFYNLVKKIMPNYKEAENWLRENAYKLIL